MNENEKKIDEVTASAEEAQAAAAEEAAAPAGEPAQAAAEPAQEPAPEKKPAQKHGKKDRLKKLHSKNFKYGSMSTLITVIVVVAAILINIGASALVKRFPSLKLDLTSDSRMTLSKDLSEIVDEVNHKTEIIFCNDKEDFEKAYNSTLQQYVGGDAITDGTRITTLAEKAAERNKNISVRYVNLDTDPSFQNKFPNETLSSQNIIIQTEYRYRVLALNDLYQQKQNGSTSSYTYYSNVEYELANALISTNLDSVPKIAFATGHGETKGETLSSVLENNNFEVSELNLMTESEISSDIDVVIISAPTTDFTPDQIKTLETFLDNGGDYGKNVFFVFTPNREKMPNLYAFLQDWGMQLGEEGAYVMESDSSKYVQQPMLPLVTVNSDDESCVKEFANSSVVAPLAVPMKTLFDYDSGITVKTLLSTASSSYVVPNGSDASYKPTAADYGANAVLAYGEKYVSKHNDMLYSRVAVCTSYYAMDSYLSATAFGNKNVTVTFFKFMTDTLGNEDSVYIPSIEFTSSDMTLNQSQVNFIGLVIFTIAIPLAVLVIGLVVWLRRRHL